MMNAVHARRDDEPHEHALHVERQAHVRVMKEDRAEEDRLPQPQRMRIDADDDHLHGANGNRKQQLTEMEPQRRRRIEIAIDVMDKMETPEERDAMIRPMPPPQRVI